VNRHTLRLCFLIGFAGMLAACGGGGASTTEDAAGQVVHQYMQAKIDTNADSIRNLLCAAQEANLDREAQSFAGVKAHLENVTCNQDANANTVTCSGAIVAEYNGENTTFPLTKYNVVQEDGQWKWCGEAN